MIGAIATTILSGCWALWITGNDLARQVPLRVILSHAGLGALVISAVAVGAAYSVANSLRLALPGKMPVVAMVGAAIFGALCGYGLQSVTYQQAKSRIDPIFSRLNADIMKAKAAYDSELGALHVEGMTDATALATGINYAEARTKLASAKKADAQFAAAVQASAQSARRALLAVSAPSRQKANALSEFDGEFVRDNAGLKQLTGYSKYRLDVLEDEVDYLAKHPWRSGRGGEPTFASPRDNEVFRMTVRYRRNAERYLAQLTRFFEHNARGSRNG